PLGCRYDKPDLSIVGFAVLQTTGFRQAPVRVRQGAVFLVFHSCYFYFRRRCDLRDLRRHRKTRASTSADELEMGLWRARHLVCAGEWLDRTGVVPGSKR